MNEQIGDLAQLESFDKKAFEPDSEVSIELCRFVLTLALIFNDLKDLMFLFQMLQDNRPEEREKLSRLVGEYSGMDIHLNRVIIGLINEVIILLNENSKVVEEPFFKKVIKQLPKGIKESWNVLLISSLGKPVDTPLGKYLLFIRNKMAFHYDPKEIYSGYQHFFSSSARGAVKRFISRGNSMSKTRYFFADAAAQGYLSKKNVNNSIKEVAEMIRHLNFTVMEIVHHFIQQRGCGYVREDEET